MSHFLHATDFLDGMGAGASAKEDVPSRVQQLEALVESQALQLKQMAKALDSVQKDARRTLSVMQYNILASCAHKMALEASLERFNGDVRMFFNGFIMDFKGFQWISRMFGLILMDLSRYLGKNTQPWFLYGAQIQPEEREKIFKLFNQRGDDGKSGAQRPSKCMRNAIKMPIWKPFES